MSVFTRIGGILILCIIMVSPALAAVGVIDGYEVEVYVNKINRPLGLSFDSKGVLYVGRDEYRGGPIYRVAPGGTSVELFGPVIWDPDSVAVDAEDYVYIGSEIGLYRVAPDGSWSLVTKKYSGNICSVAIDHEGLFGEAGTVFFGNARHTYDIARFNPSGTASQFVTNSEIYIPFGLAFDDTGYLYVCDNSTRKVYRITDNGTASRFISSLPHPFSIVFSKSEGLLYIGDLDRKKIYRVTLDGQMSVFAWNIRAYGMTFGPDGALYATNRYANPHQVVRIYKSEIPVYIDVKPGSCPNPVNTKKQGVLPVAVLGTADFDVETIDPETITIEGVSPIRYDYEDVGTPVDPVLGKKSQNECTEASADGYLDLTLKFDTQAILDALEARLVRELTDHEALSLTLSGSTFDGVSIRGEDVVLILNKERVLQDSKGRSKKNR